MTERKERNLSLDILKILSMIMVIILHTKTYGLKGVSFEISSELYWIVNTLQIFSLIAVNCFVLISGYFSNITPPEPKKLLKLWVQLEIFSVGIYFILNIIPNIGNDFAFGNFLLQVFPILSDQYWFFTCYFVLMIIAPYLNRFINTMGQREFKKCLLVFLGLFVVIPSINVFGDNFDTSNGYSAVWFVILYLVAAYLRRYPLPKKPYGIFYICISVFSVLAYAVLDYASQYLDLFGQARDIIYRYNSLVIFLAAVSLFLFFVNHPIKTEKLWGKLITKISAVSFSVYLFHEHPKIRPLLWDKTIKLFETVNSVPMYLLRLLISIVCVFVVGAVLGWLISLLINSSEKIFNKIKRK